MIKALFFDVDGTLVSFRQKFLSDGLLADLAALRERGILLRDCSNYHGLGRGWYRTAVRDGADNGRLIAALQDVLKEGTL